MSDEEKLVSHYRLKTLLRRDGFGAVYLAESTRDQKEYVLRIIELDQPTLTRITGRVRARSQRDHPLVEQIRQRVKRLSELKNSYILSVIEFGEEHIQGNNDIIFYMASPYEKESLLSYWSAHTSSAELISLEIVAELLFQAAEGLFYAHRRGLVHQYVRLSSFMFRAGTRGRKLHLYLTDFWFADITAAILEEGQISQDLSVYLASEQLAGHAVAASDQYALAILAYELLLGYRLAQVDLSLGLYERFVRQRGAGVSEADLALAHRIDLVLARALAEDAGARYQNIEEFAFTFRAVVSGEVIELEEDTAKLPAISGSGGVSARSAVEIAAVVSGGLIAGELVEEFAQVEGDETAHARHPSLHKTVLTAEGMEALEVAASSEVVEETVVSAQERMPGGAVQSGTLMAQEETLTELEEEKTSSSADAAGAAGFVAGLAVGEVLERSASRSEEQTLASESGAAFAAGEARQREIDLAAEKTMLAAGAGAAGTAAGEARQRETDSAEERTETHEGSAAAFAAGAVVGGATGLVAGAELQREADSAAEQIQIISASGGATAYERETDSAAEQTQIIPAAGGALLAGAAGLALGELLASGFEETEAARLAGGGMLAGGVENTQAGGTGADSAGAGGMSAIEKTEVIGGAAALGLAAAGLAAEGYAGGVVESGAAGLTGGSTGGGAQAVGGGGASGAAGLAGGFAGGGAGAAAGAGAAGLASGATRGVAASGAAGGATQAIGAGATGGVAESGAAGVAGVAAGLASGAAGGIAESGAAGVAGAGGGATQAVGAGAAGVAGAGVAAAGYAGGATQVASAGVIGGSSVAGLSARKRRRRGRTWWIAAILVLLLIVVFASFVYALNQSSATVTLTLESHTFQNTYLVTATTNTTTTSGQVQASFFTQTASQSGSGQASGYYAGSYASGFIKFYNSSAGCGCPVIIPAGTPFTSASGVTVVTDTVASVASLCYVTVHAHALIYGAGGDIPAKNVQAAYSSTITATNPYAFSGGQGGQGNALVQQSDIDHVAKGLKAQVVQSAQASIQAQLKSNQHLFARPDCRTKVLSDHAAGDYASSFTVTARTTCTAEAYDYSAALQVVQQQIQAEASSYVSNQYVLVNGLQTSVTSATAIDAKAGTLLLAIKAVGKWVYKLGKDIKQLISQEISGKSVSIARYALAHTIGIAACDISISGRDQSMLPLDSSKITIVVKS